MKFWVGVTDYSWFQFLRDQQPEEVNFWQPSPRAPISTLETGAPFLFKLKRPNNHIAGGGFFVKFSVLPLSVVWETFGVKNGAALWKSVTARLEKSTSTLAVKEPLAVYGAPTLINPRLGQGAFRVLVTDAYKRRCAITGEKTLPVLEAAHIVPFAQSGSHQISNGLLLRSDFHKLFDLGYVTVDRDFRVKVSPRIREEWFNGKAYYRLDRQPLASLPDAADQRPRREYLAWHNKNIFQA